MDVEGSLAAAQQLRERRGEALVALEAEVRRWLERDWCAKALGRLRSDDSAPRATTAAKALLNRLATAFFQSGSAAVGKSAEEMHRFRIAAKRFRYSLEMFAPLYPAAMKKQIQTVRSFQDVLGEMNDYATTATLVDGSHGELLKALDAGRAARAAEFDRAWKAFLKAGVRNSWRRVFAHPLRAPKAPLQNR
jgi:CHAD domain-containing protein